jgi:uncharacterized membrane protein
VIAFLGVNHSSKGGIDMTRKLALTAATAAAALMMTSSPAMATGKWGCKWTKWCSSTTSGGSTTTSGGSTSGGSTSGGSTSGGSTSGGTPVPEPGMLGMMGLGFIGLAAARRRQSRRR